jgi:ABC-type ATPase with predicted acetyltransferase domain
MYIYNITVNIEKSVEQEWLKWMQEKHIPEMLETGKFFEAKMCQVMVEESQGVTYSIQYTTDSKETLEKYYQENADQLRRESMALFKENFVAFRTELKVINHIKNFVKS